MYTSSAAANSENAEPSSASSRLNASQAKPAPSAKAAMCTTRKNSVGRSLIQLPQGICSSLSFGFGGVGVVAGVFLTSTRLSSRWAGGDALAHVVDRAAEPAELLDPPGQPDLGVGRDDGSARGTAARAEALHDDVEGRGRVALADGVGDDLGQLRRRHRLLVADVAVG